MFVSFDKLAARGIIPTWDDGANGVHLDYNPDTCTNTNFEKALDRLMVAGNYTESEWTMMEAAIMNTDMKVVLMASILTDSPANHHQNRKVSGELKHPKSKDGSIAI